MNEMLESLVEELLRYTHLSNIHLVRNDIKLVTYLTLPVTSAEYTVANSILIKGNTMKTFRQPEGEDFDFVKQVGEYCIYSYRSTPSRVAFTYWYGDRPDQYVSNLSTLEEAEAHICINRYNTSHFHEVFIKDLKGNRSEMLVVKTNPYALPTTCMYVTDTTHAHAVKKDVEHLPAEVVAALYKNLK